MTQNRSTAVMQRRQPAPDELDYFPTPPWATRAACEWISGEIGEDLSWQTVWEPACGEMFMVLPLREYFERVIATDIYRYSPQHAIHDFLARGPAFAHPDWIFTNPPFRVAAQFIGRARQLAKRGVVMFVRGAFTEGDERYQELFRPEVRPSYVVTYCERVVLLRGRLIRSGYPDPFNIDEDTLEPRKASTATAYSLVIWLPGQHDTRHRWIPACRPRLERDEDYPAYEEQWTLLREQQAQRAAETGIVRLI
jgi:hypothetical protein